MEVVVEICGWVDTHRCCTCLLRQSYLRCRGISCACMYLPDRHRPINRHTHERGKLSPTAVLVWAAFRSVWTFLIFVFLQLLRSEDRTATKQWQQGTTSHIIKMIFDTESNETSSIPSTWCKRQWHWCHPREPARGY